jgi:hypothetical protein
METSDINECTFYTKAKDSRSQCQNSGVRVDAEDSTGKMLIMCTLKKYGNWIMECLYKSLYLNVNRWSTHKVLRWMIMGSQSLTIEMWIIKMNLGFSLQLLHRCFTYLIQKMRRNASLFLRNNELLESIMWRMRKNTTNVMRCIFCGYKKDKYHWNKDIL